MTTTETVARGRLAGRIALVTGASRGLGAAVALRFAQEGAHLILIARTQGGLEELDDQIRAKGGTATLLPLDLTQFEQIDQMGGALFERFRRLDIVVGNAATLGTLSPTAHVRPKAWDQVMALNLTANYRLIRSLDLLLRQSEAGRALFVTCRAGHQARAYWGAYGASKAALEQMVRVYADEVEQTRMKVNLIDPGPLRTRLRAEAYPGEDRTHLPLPETVTEAFVGLAEAGCVQHGQLVHVPQHPAVSALY